MLIFNYSNVEIKDIITRYARFFSLPEDQLSDLVVIKKERKMIIDVLKVFFLPYFLKK